MEKTNINVLLAIRVFSKPIKELVVSTVVLVGYMETT
jgi:hypothetical protein